MPTQMLYEKTVKNAKAPAGGRSMLWDSAVSSDTSLSGSFGLRVTGNGVKSWIIMFRLNGKQQYRKIGSYPALPLSQAREVAREALKLVGQGIDPVEAKAAEKRHIASIKSVSQAVDEFVEKHVKRNNRSWKEVERVFRSYVKPAIGDRPLPSITPADIHELLDAQIDAGHPYMANRLLAHIRKFFNWCVGRHWITETPTRNIERPAEEVARDRVLSGAEIGMFWVATGELGWPFGPFLRMLMVTGQRRNEVSNMKWSQIDIGEALWKLPKHATKSKREHEVPLSSAALEILENLPRNGAYVFSTTGNTAISGFSRAKIRCDNLMATAQVPPWHLHDIRRTVASRMAEIGIAPHVIEKVQNRSTGQISGVAAIYNRYQYLREKTNALEAWARALEAIVQPVDENVVELRGRK